VLTPTRELAAQIETSFAVYGRHLKLSRAVVFGGVGQNPQVRAMAPGVDVLIATPGRLLDLMGQGFIRLDRLEIFVLDEADRMLDMGFIHDVRRVIKALPERRQSLFFSATIPPEIARLADGILTDPVRVGIRPVVSTAERIEQSIMFVEKADKRPLLTRVLKDTAIERVLVFTRTKHGADRVVKQLAQGGVAADAIHGNKSQNARTRALERFRSGAGRVLVATDIAARGIDVDGVSHVINYDLPNVPESYVHRIGRTARAGKSGVAISFCDAEERAYLRDIEALIKARIPVIADHPWHSRAPMPPTAAPEPRKKSRRRSGRADVRPAGQAAARRNTNRAAP
jgi:ATP-dependent RNA helicase RhlE